MAHRNVLCIVLGFFMGCLGADAQNVSDARTFATIRAAVRETIQGQTIWRFTNFRAPGDPVDTYDLWLGCDNAAKLGMSADNPSYRAATVALHVEIFQAELTRLRVPKSIWNRQLAALNRFGVQLIHRMRDENTIEYKDEEFDEMVKIEKSLADPVIAWGRRDARRPQFILGGCGGGEEEVTITTTPPGARVSYISLFQYKVCQARNQNPEDPARCDGWINAVKLVEDMIGKYHYIATWPDGYQAKGVFDITGKTTVNIPR